MASSEASALKDFVAAQPHELDTRIGEGGGLLSGGQKLRLSIARAFLKNAPILILDEATSALDSESEAAIKNALEKLNKGKTIVTVAHRYSTIAIADVIVVMQQGVIPRKGHCRGAPQSK